jgi:hypothetical protein
MKGHPEEGNIMKKRGKKYDPTQVMKNSGVHTFYIGETDSPLFEALEAYLWINEKTFSEGTRNILTLYFQSIGVLDENMQKTKVIFDIFRETGKQLHKEQLKRVKRTKKLINDIRF